MVSQPDLEDGGIVVSTSAPRADVVVVRVIGEIDLATAPEWRRALEAAVVTVSSSRPRRTAGARVDAPVAPRLVCDLSGATFFGVTGLGVLVDMATTAAEYRCELRLVAESGGRVSRLLRMTGLEHRFVVHGRLDLAVGPGARRHS